MATTNTLPDIPPCPEGQSRTTECSGAAKARWTRANASSKVRYDAAMKIATEAFAKRINAYNEAVRPSDWTDFRWLRHKARLRQAAYRLNDVAVGLIVDNREAEWIDTNEAYVADMAACCKPE